MSHTGEGWEEGKLISEIHCTCGQAVDAQTAVTAAVGQSAFRSSWDVASVYFPTMSSEVPSTRFLSERLYPEQE